MSERWLSQPAQRGDFRRAVTSQADDMVKYACNVHREIRLWSHFNPTEMRCASLQNISV